MMRVPGRRINRRDFLQDSLTYPALAALFTAGITISCADDSGDSNSNGNGDDEPSCGDADCTIGSNHGHTVSITQAQLDAGNAVTLTLTTGNGHTHTLDLTAQDVQDVAAEETVSATSSFNGHTHLITFN